LLTDFVCLYNYEFRLSLCKIARSSVILLLPLFADYLWYASKCSNSETCWWEIKSLTLVWYNKKSEESKEATRCCKSNNRQYNSQRKYDWSVRIPGVNSRTRGWGKDWILITTNETYPWSFETNIFPEHLYLLFEDQCHSTINIITCNLELFSDRTSSMYMAESTIKGSGIISFKGLTLYLQDMHKKYTHLHFIFLFVFALVLFWEALNTFIKIVFLTNPPTYIAQK
jgi:hypothetical protein